MAEAERRTSSRLALLGFAVGITATIIAWGVLVLAAIDFGRDARGGSADGWLFLGAASLGAVACLFLAIILASKLQARLRNPPAQARGETAPDPLSNTREEPSGPAESAVDLDDEGLPPAAEPTTTEPAPTYHSRHSNASVDPATADTEDSPAAQYRGKRAAR